MVWKTDDDFNYRRRGTVMGNWGRMFDKMGQPTEKQPSPGPGYPEIWKVLGIVIFLFWLMSPSQGPARRNPPTEGPWPQPLVDRQSQPAGAPPLPSSASPELTRHLPAGPAPTTLPISSDGRTSAAASNQVAPIPALPLKPVVFSAKHKHRMRDCDGILTLSAETIRFDTDHSEDSFVYPIEQVQLDEDGVKDPNGRAWHFRVEGRDMRDTFRLWKTGELLQ